MYTFIFINFERDSFYNLVLLFLIPLLPIEIEIDFIEIFHLMENIFFKYGQNIFIVEWNQMGKIGKEQ